MIEQAETHYAAAFIASKYNFMGQCAQQLENAKQSYDSVRRSLPQNRLFMTSGQRRLQSAAQDGLRRVNAAPTFDLVWLYQPSNIMQQKPDPVSKSSREDGV